MAVGTIATLGLIVQGATALDAHQTSKKVAKERKKFTAQAKEEALEERKSLIDEQRLQLGVGSDTGYKTKQTTGYAGLVNQGETLG